MKLITKQTKAAENDVCFLSLRFLGMSGELKWDHRITHFRAAVRSWKNDLGGSRTGRLFLHAMCMVQHPERAGWHWQGMVREFAH